MIIKGCRQVFFFTALAFILLAGCSHLPGPKPSEPVERIAPQEAEKTGLQPEKCETPVADSGSDSENEFLETSTELQSYQENPADDWKEEESLEVDEFPISRLEIPNIPFIERCQEYFLRKNRCDYLRGLERRRQYQVMIQEKVRQRGMPESVAWIPMVESWFDISARSPAHAVGLWQLMPAIARQFGLRIDDWIDERKDPVKSTDAALNLLAYLHQKTGCWFLTYAAYHSGESDIVRTVRENGNRDFWTLSADKKFASRTRFFVGAIMALAAIERNIAFHDIEFPQPDCGFVSIDVPSQIDLHKFAEKTGISFKELKRLNPALKKSWTPPDYPGFRLNIPRENAGDIAPLQLCHAQASAECIEHLIQPGDTLSSISEHYEIPIESIIATNGLTESLIIAGKKLLIPIM